MFRSAARRCAPTLALILVGAAPAFGQSFPPAPTPEVAAEVRAALASMKQDERGPFVRIRWFCDDGTVHAPQGTPCRERGGGRQHAEHGPLAQRLAALGYNVGSILVATPYEAFADEGQAGFRLRELVLERYLMDVDDGWVMRRARYYRGALQIEDEERAGRAPWSSASPTLTGCRPTICSPPVSPQRSRTPASRRTARWTGSAPLRPRSPTWTRASCGSG